MAALSASTPRNSRNLCALLLSLGALLSGGACGGEAELDIFAVEPRNGAQNAETPIKISGTGFKDDVGYTVFFGTVQSSAVMIADPNTLMVKSPVADEPGPVDIALRSDDGHAFILRGAYTYVGGGGNVMEQMGENGGKKAGSALVE